jgi:hypothetical protein
MILSLPSWANALFAPSLIWLLVKVNDEVDGPDTNSNDANADIVIISVILDEELCFFNKVYVTINYKYVKYEKLEYLLFQYPSFH